ncbi:hypothetical protein L226DRAFT_160263 [Lentinus tigrinus ALCF2SS1-7]|uniref:uncharacterized protein n=1 Tax=Lentinus tigrinus ALCF2SS1-7 TaxID=1328758 RepID=UPI0011660CD3|nr:hypothetical protein L226DRAFT_160263 [Lentinus tigrinus ALCF2SS1-7]
MTLCRRLEGPKRSRLVEAAHVRPRRQMGAYDSPSFSPRPRLMQIASSTAMKSINCLRTLAFCWRPCIWIRPLGRTLTHSKPGTPLAPNPRTYPSLG